MQTNSQTAVYRFYDTGGALLYVGISVRPWERWRQHRADKPWWNDVASITLEPHPTRQEALKAERAAIVAERPLHNVMHNSNVGRIHERVIELGDNGGEWYFESIRSGFARQTDLYVMPEPNNLAVLSQYDHLDELTGAEQVDIYIDHLRSQSLLSDRINIYWTIAGEGLLETAPGSGGGAHGRDFLTHFTWPENVETGERCSFYRLAVRHRFPAFWEALGYEPAPLQTTLPLLSILNGRPATGGTEND